LWDDCDGVSDLSEVGFADVNTIELNAATFLLDNSSEGIA